MIKYGGGLESLPVAPLRGRVAPQRPCQAGLDLSVWNIPTCMYASLLETCCDKCAPISTHTFHLLLLLREPERTVPVHGGPRPLARRV